MKTSKIWALGIFLLCSLSTLVRASEFNPKLGKGVNSSETKTFASCVTGIETQTDTVNPALSRLYHEKRIKSRDDLHKALDINASVSAKGLWGDAGGKAGYFSNVTMSSEAFYWLVDAVYERSVSSIKTDVPRFTLTEKAKSILRDHGIERFYEACGTHFYSGQKIGARYSLLYEFTSNSDRSVSRITASANYEGFGVKANADFRSFIKQGTENSSLRVHSTIIGGDDKIKDYVKDPDQLEAELSNLRRKLYDEEKGVVLKWFLDSYDQFPEVQDAKAKGQEVKLIDLFRNDALTKYYNLYNWNKESVLKLETLIQRSTGEEPFFIFSEEKMAEIRQIIYDLERQNDLIQERAVECLTKDKLNICKYDDLGYLSYKTPKPDKDMSHFGDWEIVPIILQDSDKSHPFFELRGHSQSMNIDRDFETSFKLFTSPSGGVHILVRHWEGIVGEMVLGSVYPVIDPRTGRSRPRICMGEYEDICSIRLIENPSITLSDGSHPSKIQLTIFNDKGFVFKKFEFFAKN